MAIMMRAPPLQKSGVRLDAAFPFSERLGGPGSRSLRDYRF
jgi:hypothetical protein